MMSLYRTEKGLMWPNEDIECAAAVFYTMGDLEYSYRHCRSFDVAIQAGGNCGVWPAEMGKKFRRLYTFEPDPINFRCLCANAPAENIIKFNAALGEQHDLVGLRKETGNVGAHQINGDGDIPTMLIDDLALRCCDLIYLDIEGYELQALRGAIQTINRCRPVIAIEDKGLSASYGIAKGDCIAWLEAQCNYRVAERINRDVVLVPKEDEGSKMNELFDPTDLRPVQFDPNAGCNVTDAKLMEQVAANIRRQLPQVQPHMVNDNVVAFVCGGPSLASTEKELVELVWSGAKVVAVNGAYQWCIDHNIKPTAMVMIDARGFNSRFLETPVPGCKYLLASQCHPNAFEICKDRDTTIWHACSAGDAELELLKEFYFDKMYVISGGTTVAIRAIWLMRMLGFQTFHTFGLDSCWMGDSHHAYSQKENDLDACFPVWLRPQGRDDLAKQFFCSPWQMKQAEDWETLIRTRGDDFRVQVHGDGLIANMMRIAAELGSASISIEKQT